MNTTKYELPEINPALLHTEIVDWSFQDKLFKDHGKYCLRYKLVFEDGRIENRQTGGFSTKKAAITEKQNMIAKLFNHEYVAFPNITVKEYYDYWLYQYIMIEKKSSYNVFMLYRNVIYNYIVPVIGNRKLVSIKRNDIVKVLERIPYKSVLKAAEHVFRYSFSYGKAKNFLENNVAVSAINDNRSRIQMEKKQNVNQSPHEINTPKKNQTYNLNQVCRLLTACKATNSIVYLPLLITLTTGVRISELIAIKFSDIDYFDKLIYISSQLGRKLEFMEESISSECRNQECKTKTPNSVRALHIPDITLEEIILEKKKRTLNGSAHSPYLFCTPDGKSVHRNYFKASYKQALELANLPYIKWHDLRHTYATILYNNNINLKAISVSLGHATEYFTKDVYIEEEPEIPVATGLDSLKEFIDEIFNNIPPVKQNVFNMHYPWEIFLPQ